MRKSFKIKRPLAWIMSLALTAGCFSGVSLMTSASGTDNAGGTAGAEVFTLADFEDKTSPFTFSKDNNTNATFYTYNGNTALVLSDGPNNNLSTRLPAGSISGTAASTDAMNLFSYNVGNEGYRPTKVSFQMKPVGRASNTHLLLHPLTFTGVNGKNPNTNAFVLDIMVSSAKSEIAWSSSYSGLYVGKISGTNNVFTGVSDTVVGKVDAKNPTLPDNATLDATPFGFATAGTVLNAGSTEEEKLANATMIESIGWYTVEITYDWSVAGQVTVDAIVKSGTEEHHNKYTVTYDETLITGMYNVGLSTDNESNMFLIDNFALYSESLETGETIGPDYTGTFKEKYADLLSRSVESITLEDETIVKNALADYNNYSSEDQALLKNEKATLDSFLEKINELKGIASGNEYEQYLQEHTAALSLITSTVGIEHKEIVEAALADYQILSSDTQKLLAEQKAHLDELMALIQVLETQQELNYEQPTVDQGFQGYPKHEGNPPVEDFESEDSIKIWHTTAIMEESSGTALINGGNSCEIAWAADPTDPSNHVIEVKGVAGAAVPYAFALPEHASLTSLKFDLVQYEACGYTGGYVLFPAYKDKDNYAMVELQLSSTTGEAKYRWGGMINGVTTSKGSGSQGSLTGWDTVDYKEGLTVEFSYNPASLQINVSLTSIATDVNGEHVTTSFSIPYGKADWTFALGSRYNPYATPQTAWTSAYYDNLSATFVEGDWDDDEEILKPIVYFTENTLVTGGDTVLIYGANLADTVSSVDIVQLPEETTEGAGPGYILQNRYDRSAAEAEYTASSDAAAAFTSAATEDGAVIHMGLTILQTTQNCLKIALPEDLTKGVYALRFNPKVSGQEPAYAYMNGPVLDYYVGSEGEVAVAGQELRVIGKGLALDAADTIGRQEVYTNTADMGVRAWIKGEGGYSTEAAVTAVQSNYSVSVQMPADIPNGEYEIYIYNGYGGDTAWSVPISFTVGNSPWNIPDRVFNVLDYGASTAVTGNDTPGIIAALDAAAQNGGGTVYLPAGFYNIYYAIPLPQNVRLMGDGREQTRIIFNYTPFDFGELPQGIFITEGDNEVCDLAIYSVREFPVFTSSVADIENLYIHDCTLRVHRYQGVLGQGGGGTPLDDPDGKSLETLFSEENAGEGKKLALIFKNRVINLKVTNNIIEGTGSFIFAKTSYSLIADNELNISDQKMNKIYDGECNILENNTSQGYFGGTFEGNGMYVANNEMGNVNANNREIITSDGKPNYSADERKGVIEKVDPDDPENQAKYAELYAQYDPDCFYRFSDGSTYKTENQWENSNLMVTQGQGEIQLRTIVYSKDDLIVVDNPFVVEPNRNSRVQIEDARQNYTNVNNEYVNGGKVGTFGVQVGVVYDGNTFDSCLGYNHVSQGDGVVWYISMVNTLYYNGSFWHTAGSTDVTGETTGQSGVSFESRSVGNNGFTAIIIRDIDFNQGAGITFLNPERVGYGDFLIDNCRINDSEQGIEFREKSGANPAFTGITITGLSCTEVATPITGNYQQMMETQNDYGSYYLVINYNPTSDPIKGDVNSDGVVDSKDVEMIRSYLIGKLEFTDVMLQNAEMNMDGSITMADAVEIRLYIEQQAAEGN